MLNLKVFALIAEALPQCSVLVSNGDLLIVDCNAEIVGEISFKDPCVIVYKQYSFARKVVRRLKQVSVPVELREQSEMMNLTKILYDSPS